VLGLWSSNRNFASQVLYFTELAPPCYDNIN